MTNTHFSNRLFSFFPKFQQARSASVRVLWGAQRETQHRHWECTRLWWSGLVLHYFKTWTDITANSIKTRSVTWRTKAVLHRRVCASCVTDEDSHTTFTSMWRGNVKSGVAEVYNHSAWSEVYKQECTDTCFVQKDNITLRNTCFIFGWMAQNMVLWFSQELFMRIDLKHHNHIKNHWTLNLKQKKVQKDRNNKLDMGFKNKALLFHIDINILPSPK